MILPFTVRQPPLAMNLLFVVPYVPTPIRVRPYNLIRALAARGHRITLATLWTDAAEHRALDDLEAWGVRVIAEHLPRARSLGNCLCALPTATPLQAVYCWSPRLRAGVRPGRRAGQRGNVGAGLFSAKTRGLTRTGHCGGPAPRSALRAGAVPISRNRTETRGGKP